MRHVQRWLVLLLIGLIAQAAPLWAQATPTTPPTIPLAFGQPVESDLSAGDSDVYRFEIPRDQDVVIAISADKVVTNLHCSETITATETQRECPGGGGGDGDGPVYRVSYFPMNADPDVRQFIDMTVYRPDAFDSAAHYVLTGYLVTPEPLALDTVQPVDDGDPFHVYTFDNDVAQAFSLEIEQDSPDGEFLWAAYTPYNTTLDTSDQPMDAQYVDGAVGNPPSALTTLWLFYSGGDSFRALVGANSAHTLYASRVDETPLDAGTPLTSTVSHRQPISLLRLNTASGDHDSSAGTLTLDLAQGESLDYSIFSAGERAGGSTLGYAWWRGDTLPRAQTVDLLGSADTVIVLTLPLTYTRDPITVTLEWELSS